MRVTNQMISQQFMRNLNKNYRAVETLQGQISSGKLYDKISSNPGSALKSMSHKTELMQLEQYRKNANDGIDWSLAMDDALDDVTGVLQRVRELTVQAGNDTFSPVDRKNIAIEVRSLLEQAGSIANTTFGGGYLFSGKDSHIQPYQDGSLQPVSGEGMKWAVGKGMAIQVQVSAASVFGHSVAGKNVFETLEALSSALENGENPDGFLPDIDKQMDHVLGQRAMIGTNQNLFEQASNRLDQAHFLTEKMLAQLEGTDIAKAFTELTLQETAIKASLSAGAKIMQQSLADFLR
ncbi:flagellar hook-associated protein 3 [Neobacillus notoginsengisoli]|uniref:Flagellar hook-associated protein 3 n=1 Tax=Neobacillus notoginsengisoli TaxID=1578198 RepID=A0A417YJI8_9BACI|nr:flagellar hook-associated protein FlgL [Neobacillus notoginsengisoli]RHW33324.1 flagellar hook-associated protein 3 [Neobacillus notoginsengisoli]